MAIAVTWIIEMWSGKVLAAALQALQLAFGVGTILGPFLVRPHLYGYMNSTQAANMSLTEYENEVSQRRKSLTEPFIISAVLTGSG